MTNEVTSADEAVVPGVNFSELLGDPATNPVKPTALEKALATVEPSDAAAVDSTQAKFQFRDMLTETQRKDLVAAAPRVAAKFIKDYNAIISFGAPVMEKLGSTSTQILEQQKEIELPAADALVNDLLREIDGYSKKYRNPKAEEGIKKLIKKLKGTAYSMKTLVRESKPIVDRINMAEVKLKEGELRLADNIARGQQLHKNTTEILQEVVTVLAALEEIVEVIRTDFNEADTVLKSVKDSDTVAGGFAIVEFKGQKMAVNELQEVHATLAQAVSEVEKSWFDWRQQFFLGFAQAPSIRNLVLVSATMQRRLQVFRTMGLPSARSSLAMWQQAALAKEAAELGTAVQDATNKLIQSSFEATGQAVTEVAMASQAPIITEETIWAVVDSIKAQADGLMAADKWGRDMRARNLQALERGEVIVTEVSTESRRQLVANAVATASGELEAAPTPDEDILGQLGVTK